MLKSFAYSPQVAKELQKLESGAWFAASCALSARKTITLKGSRSIVPIPRRGVGGHGGGCHTGQWSHHPPPTNLSLHQCRGKLCKWHPAHPPVCPALKVPKWGMAWRGVWWGWHREAAIVNLAQGKALAGSGTANPGLSGSCQVLFLVLNCTGASYSTMIKKKKPLSKLSQVHPQNERGFNCHLKTTLKKHYKKMLGLKMWLSVNVNSWLRPRFRCSCRM